MNNSIAIGYNAVATSLNSVAIGRNAVATAWDLIEEVCSVPDGIQHGDAFHTDENSSVAIYLKTEVLPPVDTLENPRCRVHCMRNGKIEKLIVAKGAHNRIRIVSRISDAE